MQLDKLYSRRSDGKVQIWTIEISGDKYRVHSGIKDGSIVTSEWTICQPKNVGRANATTPEEQAILEAKAKWKKQKDEGYFEDEAAIDTETFFSPMLAKKYEDYADDIKFPIFCQRKYDGIRLIVRKSGCYSRTGKSIVSVPHIHKALLHIFDKYPNMIFDGEAYVDKYANDFNAIVSLVKKAKPTAKDLEESKIVKFNCYDCSLDDIFSKRSKFIADVLKDIPECIIVATDTAYNQGDLDKFYEQYMSEGYEGQIIRLDKAYENKRSKYLLKRKEFVDEEYTILGVEEGVGNRSGTVGYMSFKTKEGQPFKSNVKGTRNYVRRLWSIKDTLIGKTATIKYFRLTPAGIPRFPYVIKIDREAYE